MKMLMAVLLLGSAVSSRAIFLELLKKDIPKADPWVVQPAAAGWGQQPAAVGWGQQPAAVGWGQQPADPWVQPAPQPVKEIPIFKPYLEFKPISIPFPKLEPVPVVKPFPILKPEFVEAQVPIYKPQLPNAFVNFNANVGLQQQTPQVQHFQPQPPSNPSFAYQAPDAHHHLH